MVHETQISKPPEPTMNHNSKKLLILLPIRAELLFTLQYEIPCIYILKFLLSAVILHLIALQEQHFAHQFQTNDNICYLFVNCAIVKKIVVPMLCFNQKQFWFVIAKLIQIFLAFLSSKPSQPFTSPLNSWGRLFCYSLRNVEELELYIGELFD